MTPHSYETVDCGAFCEVIFFCISPKKLLGDFFDSLSRTLQSENPRHYTRLEMIILKWWSRKKSVKRENVMLNLIQHLTKSMSY